MRRDELPEHIPTLAELFAECGSDFHLSLDLKGDDTGEAVIEVVRRHAPDLMPRLWLCHTELDVLIGLRDTDAQAKLRLVKKVLPAAPTVSAGIRDCDTAGLWYSAGFHVQCLLGMVAGCVIDQCCLNKSKSCDILRLWCFCVSEMVRLPFRTA